jgi:hypothetical protein
MEGTPAGGKVGWGGDAAIEMSEMGRDTTGFRAFAESGDTLGEGPFPLVEAFAERKPSAKVTRCTACR